MLTEKEMSSTEFDAWKDTNSWFFDVLKARQIEYKEAVDSLLQQFSVAPFSFTDHQKQVLITYAQRGSQLQDVIDIDYSDVVEADNES
tara:strand:- start:1233 stop:1496 length:264 start_codon:yes stop_codon:yes gene_type:complete